MSDFLEKTGALQTRLVSAAKRKICSSLVPPELTARIGHLTEEWRQSEEDASRFLDAGKLEALVKRESSDARRGADPVRTSQKDYQERHETNVLYRTNNWLLGAEQELSRYALESVTEIGCGNGQFCRIACRYSERVIGVDWALSSALTNMPDNFAFLHANIVTDPIPSANFLCSSDVLEHIHPDDIMRVIDKLNSAGAAQYHVIACYHDYDSHLTIVRPSRWLAMFRAFSARFELHAVSLRRGNPAQVTCTIVKRA